MASLDARNNWKLDPPHPGFLGGPRQFRGEGLSGHGACARPSPMRTWVWFLASFLLLAPARADRAEELANIHIEVIGGRERIAALHSFRATGTVTMSGKSVRFTLVAARPNKFRLDVGSGGRSLVQGYDGFQAPWEFDTGQWPPRYRPMAEQHARRFVADAEFDDPLVGGKARDFAIDYAGEVESNGRKYFRLLVTHRLAETFALLLDPTTYLIDLRIEAHANSLGRKEQVVTRYEDYQAVDGVLLPHKVTTTIDGVVTQVMHIERVEPNPATTAETFTRQMVTAPIEAPKGKKK
jgi:hypothetical protein